MKDITEVVKSIKKLPPMPAVVNKILRIANDPSTSAKSMIKVIELDQNITANVLKLCNSSYYALPKKVASLSDAVVYLGNQTLVDMVLAGFSADMMGGESNGYLMKSGQLWEHSVTCATLAKEIAKAANCSDAQIAYSSGLMHDIGKVIMDKFLAEEVEEISKKAEKEDRAFDEIEKEVIGFTHAEIGAMLTREWGLPEEIINAIKYHHAPEEAPEGSKVVYVVHIADALSAMFGFSSGIDGLAYDFSATALDVLGIDEKQLYSMAPALIETVFNATNMLG